MGHLLGAQAGFIDGLLHSEIGERGGISHEPPGLTIDPSIQIDVHTPGHLAAEAELAIRLVEANPRSPLLQRREHCWHIVAQAGHDPPAGHHDAPHDHPITLAYTRETNSSSPMMILDTRTGSVSEQILNDFLRGVGCLTLFEKLGQVLELIARSHQRQLEIAVTPSLRKTDGRQQRVAQTFPAVGFFQLPFLLHIQILRLRRAAIAQ